MSMISEKITEDEFDNLIQELNLKISNWHPENDKHIMQIFHSYPFKDSNGVTRAYYESSSWGADNEYFKIKTIEE